MREIAMLSDNPEMSIEEQMSFDPLTGSRVADIIEKYMDDAGDGVPATAGLLVGEPDVEVDPMMELVAGMGTPAPRTPVGIEELPAAAPRTPVSMEELPPMPRPALDASAMDSLEREIRVQDEGLAGLMAGQMAPLRASDIEPMAEYRPGQVDVMRAMRVMSQSPSTRRPEGMSEAQNEAFTRMMKSQLANEVFPRTGMTPEDTYDLVMSGDAEAEGKMFDRMSGPTGREYTEQRGRLVEGDRENQALALGSAFIPMTAIPKLAAQAGISASVVNRLINSGPAGIKRLTSMIKSKLTPIPNKTPGDSQTIRQRVPLTPTRNPLQEKLYQQMQNPGGPTGGLAQGGAVRDNILRNYAMMADGKSVSRHLGIKPEQGKSTFPKYEMYFPTSPEEISDIRDRLDEDKSYGRQIRKYLNPYYLSDVLSKMGKDD
jgi:hypothetical protein